MNDSICLLKCPKTHALIIDERYGNAGVSIQPSAFRGSARLLEAPQSAALKKSDDFHPGFSTDGNNLVEMPDPPSFTADG